LEHIVNEDSNYCFGEGGAGTFSDGKLYTRSKKRGNVRQILELLVGFGANPEILVEAHPHIGTNKLPAIITAIRKLIIARGGAVHFNTQVTGMNIKGDQISGVKTAGGRTYSGNQVILATGHSARDIYEMLHRSGIEIHAKSFALGVRVEHPQLQIDQIQYGIAQRGLYLPPASYSLVHQTRDRGVYSFCMCPGGIVAPCATAPGEVVTNGWSPSSRDRKTANSGIVVELHLGDFVDAKNDPLSGLKFQRAIEQKAWVLGGKTQAVPAQRLVDFCEGKISKDLPGSSYKPGPTSVDLKEVFPEFIHKALQAGFRSFEKKMKGYLTNVAIVHATESRTSSPIRIPRDKTSLQHVRIRGLYPCGEGAGYAGGIISAAIDGVKCAEACCR